MDDDLENPYRPYLWLTVLGGLMGACVPFAYGMHSLYILQQPLPPGVGGCGLAVFGAFVFTAFGPPVGAFLMVVSGIFLGGCLELWRNRCLERRDAWDQ